MKEPITRRVFKMTMLVRAVVTSDYQRIGELTNAGYYTYRLPDGNTLVIDEPLSILRTTSGGTLQNRADFVNEAIQKLGKAKSGRVLVYNDLILLDICDERPPKLLNKIRLMLQPLR